MSTNSADNQKFVPPIANKPASVDKEQTEHGSAEKRAVAAAKKETPVAVRTRRYFMQEVHLSSPSDAQLSPCTTKLFGKGGKKMATGPTAILRNKQQNAIPSNVNDYSNPK